MNGSDQLFKHRNENINMYYIPKCAIHNTIAVLFIFFFYFNSNLISCHQINYILFKESVHFNIL